MKLYQWKHIDKEQLNPHIARQVIHSERMTVARLYLQKGAIVPRHYHEAEQVTVLVAGRLRFVFENGQQMVEAGEVMQIRPNAPHEVHALEDSIALDVFAPVREDWIRGEDAYLRR